MRSSGLLLTVSLCIGLALLGCSKPPAGNGTDNASAGNTDASNTDSKGATGKNGKESKERKEAKREPLIVPGGTTLTVSLGSALGSKLNQAGQIFTGSVAKDVVVGKAVAIPQGAPLRGTFPNANPLSNFPDAPVLHLRLHPSTTN